MIHHFTEFVRNNGLFSKTGRILLTVSGGIDSVVMADLFHKSGFSFGIAHCNFSLRGKESDLDEEFTRKLAAGYKVQFYTKRFETKAFSALHKISVQMAARELRYNWFEEIRSSYGFDCIATAHHLDDQAETFLINLLRGTGISGLHGILPIQGLVVRPMLFAYRKDIIGYARENSIRYREDSSNLEEKYLRNKIRHKIIPQLEELNPEFRKTLTSEISILREWEKVGRKEIKRKITGLTKKQKGTTIVDLAALKKTSAPEICAWEILSAFGFNPDAVSGIMEHPGETSGRTFLSPTHRAVTNRDSLIIEPLGAVKVEPSRMISEKTKRLSIPLGLKISLIDYRKNKIIPAGREFASLDYDKLNFPLELRKWKPGDSFHPFRMKGKKKVSDLLIDEKASLPEKEQTYVLCSSGKITWVVGRRIDQRFSVTSKTTIILRLILSHD
jgi:tRNA(Ile)-lysidine synthase